MRAFSRRSAMLKRDAFPHSCLSQVPREEKGQHSSAMSICSRVHSRRSNSEAQHAPASALSLSLGITRFAGNIRGGCRTRFSISGCSYEVFEISPRKL